MGTRYTFTYKHTRKRFTRHCDGSITEEILDVWYSGQWCWARQWSCEGGYDVGAVCVS